MTSPSDPYQPTSGQQPPVTDPYQPGYGQPPPPPGYQGQPGPTAYDGQPPQGAPYPGQPQPVEQWAQQQWPQPGGYPQQGSWQQPTPDRGVAARKLAGWISLGGAGVLALGSVLPWASVAFIGSVYGLDGDGAITLVVAVLVGVLALLAGLGKGKVWMFGVTLFLGLIATAVGAYDLANISSLVSGESMAELGPGLPIVVVGGLGVVGAAVFGLVKGRR